MTRNPSPLSRVPISLALAAPDSFLTIFPLRRANAPPGLVAFLAETFNAVVAAGRTYPYDQEHSVDQFAAVFFRESFRSLSIAQTMLSTARNAVRQFRACRLRFKRVN